MKKKVSGRYRRARKVRSKVKMLGIHRLSVFRSSRHIYAQLSSNDGAEIITSASTIESSLKGKNNGDIKAASKVGKLIAERALEKGITNVAFDRSGYRYHGRVKALAEKARETGLEF